VLFDHLSVRSRITPCWLECAPTSSLQLNEKIHLEEDYKVLQRPLLFTLHSFMSIEMEVIHKNVLSLLYLTIWPIHNSRC